MKHGAHIRAARKAAGYTGQVGFARALGTDQCQVSRWETDKHQPSPRWQARIVEIVGDPSLFADDEDEEVSSPYDDLLEAFRAVVERLEAAERARAA